MASIIEFKGERAARIAEQFTPPAFMGVADTVRTVRLRVEGAEVSVKVNEGGWSAPFEGTADLPSVDAWNADHAAAAAFVEGMAFQSDKGGPMTMLTTRALRSWVNSFAVFYAGRPSNISGMEGDRSMAEWFRYWRFVEEDESEEDLPDWHGDDSGPPEQDADGYREGDIDLSSPTESAESIRAGER